MPPIACFSATAKEDVKKDLLNYFESELSQKLEIFDGGTGRSNSLMMFRYQHEKTSAIISLIKKEIPNSEDGAAVVFVRRKENLNKLRLY